MLTPDSVLETIKLNLGFPYKGIEHSDEVLLSYIRKKTIPLFSSYVPDVAFLEISEQQRHPQISNLYLLRDPEGRDIITVRDVILPLAVDLIMGHPWPVFPSMEELPIQALETFEARTRKGMSLARHAWEFIPPDKLYVYPQRIQFPMIIRYERIHAPDFSTIPTRWEREFIDLALADVLELIGSIRSQYQTVSTPFGEITLNPDFLNTKASELRTAVMEKLNSLPPNILVEVS